MQLPANHQHERFVWIFLCFILIFLRQGEELTSYNERETFLICFVSNSGFTFSFLRRLSRRLFLVSLTPQSLLPS